MSGDKPALEAVLALDLLCLKGPDGGPLDAETHRQALSASLQRSEWASVHRDGALVAYGCLWPVADNNWFVGGLAIHPAHRSSPTIAALGRAMADVLKGLGPVTLRSHVRRGNVASLRLHRRLGFAVEQENERAVAFVAEAALILARLPG